MLTRRGERGSIAMGVMVLLVCATLAAALVARNVAAANQSVQAQHRAQALGAAEMGLAHAEAAVAAGASGSFRAEGSTGSATWVVDVAEEADGTFLARSTGRAASASRTVELRLQSRADGVHRDRWHEVGGSP
jgi:hypothetical protein